MPLGLLAKDSIQDLEALAAEESKHSSSDEQPLPALQQATPTDSPLVEGKTVDRPIDKRSGLPFIPGDNDENETVEQEEKKEPPEITTVDGASTTSSHNEDDKRPKRTSQVFDYAGAFDDSYYYGYHHPPQQQGQQETCWCLNWFRKTPQPLWTEQTETAAEDALSKDGSTASNEQLGEKLSSRERQAVLNRLRLPDQIIDSPTRKKGLVDLETETSKTKRGILKTTKKSSSSKNISMDTKNNTSNNINQRSSTANPATTTRRRSLFPTYEPSSTGGSKKHLRVSFAPMARVVTVRSKNDMLLSEKADIWWQKTDYEDFRKTGRIITRAMLEGGSEIWLASQANDDDEDKDMQGDKWWHKFGHSRRGLEHVVSMEEGRQRQMNVKHAIRSVIEEQSRQKLYKRVDPEKLRTAALQHTSWARDLALASGASDADAVRCSFKEERRSREFYLLKMARNRVKSIPLPQFMRPNIPKKPTLKLDAHTAAQIQFRRRKNSMETTEPLHDSGKTDMKKQAQGFAVDGEKVNMAAVLSGMGANLDEETPSTMKVAS